MHALKTKMLESPKEELMGIARHSNSQQPRQPIN